MNITLEQLVPRVFGFALRLTGDRHRAEDLTQETFLRAWRSGQARRDAEQARVWLFQIAANAWRDQLRRQRLAPERAGPLDLQQPGLPSDPGLLAEQRDEVAKALAALDALPGRQREVLYLAACEALTNQEIAVVLDCTSDAVKTNLSIARRKLREQIQPTAQDLHA